MKTAAKALPRGLGYLELLLAFNAIGGGWYGLSGAPAVPTGRLAGTPFSNYFIPSLILLLVVGGSALYAGLCVIRRSPRARIASAASGLILLVWIGVQLALIGYLSWLQPAMAALALLILLLTYLSGQRTT